MELQTPRGNNDGRLQIFATNEDIPTQPEKSSKKNKIIALIGAAGILLAGFVGYKALENNLDNKDQTAATESGDSLYTGRGYEGDTTKCGPDFAENSAMSILAAQGFSRKDYTIISNETREVSVNEAGEGAFSDPANSKQEFMQFLNSGSDEANAYAKEIAKESDSKVQDVKTNGESWVFVKFNDKTTLPENTIYDNGQVVKVGERDNKAGDAVFIFVGDKACQVAVNSNEPTSPKTVNEIAKHSTLGRAGCLNPQYEWPIPFEKHDTKPPVNPNPNPEPSPEPNPTKPTLTPKDPSKDVLRNPKVPDQVKGPGTGVHEPAKKPVDSGNGGAPKKELPAPPVNPPSGPGTGDVLPPKTENPLPADGAPSPENPAVGNPEDF